MFITRFGGRCCRPLQQLGVAHYRSSGAEGKKAEVTSCVHKRRVCDEHETKRTVCVGVFLLMCFLVRNKMFADLQSLTCRFVGLEQSLFAGFRFEVQTRYKFTDDAAAILNSTRCMKISSYHKAKSSCHSSTSLFSHCFQDYCLQPAACRKPGRIAFRISYVLKA